MKTLLLLPFLIASPVRAASQDQTYEQLKTLVDVLDFIQENYVDEPETRSLIYGAAAGMVRTLDPFSQFMDPDAHRDIKTETEGQYGGLGLRIMIRDEVLTVITPLPGTPVYRAGILPNDRIVEIDGKSTRDMSLEDALKLLKGNPGTKVKLKIMRSPEDGGDGPWSNKEFIVSREIVKIESVQSWEVQKGIGYLRIIEFTARTTEDVASALKQFKKDGVESLVLDLRNNPGGLLSSAVEVASMFLGESKLIVYTQGRKADSRQDFRAGASAPHPTLPLVVLVNEGSASGAEIVAGAMQDHKRAVILGMPTYGKASVQSVIPLGDGSGLRLTVARYYTPSGRSIQRDEKKGTGGIVPDLEVPLDDETQAKLAAQFDLVYRPGKKPESVVPENERIVDEALERSIELLRARDVLVNLKPKG